MSLEHNRFLATKTGRVGGVPSPWLTDPDPIPKHMCLHVRITLQATASYGCDAERMCLVDVPAKLTDQRVNALAIIHIDGVNVL